MTRKKEKTLLEKKNWTASFNLIGRAIVTPNTFLINEHSQNSDWIYNKMSLFVDCGKYGRIDCSMMGGYGYGRDNIVYVHGKDENGRDDFSNFYSIDWEDRKDESILSSIGGLCFKTVGLRKDVKGKTYYKKILHEYDAIQEISDNLENGDIVNIKGQLRYQIYNGNVIVNKEVNSIVYSNIEDEADFKAVFTQTILLDKECISKNDKDRKTLSIAGYVLEKFKEYNGYDLTENGTYKGGKFIPLTFEYEYEYSDIAPEKIVKVIDKLFKIKKDIRQVTFDGIFKEQGAIVKTTLDDLTDDIRELIDLGIYTEEEALTICAGNGGRERKMILVKPHIKNVIDSNGEVQHIIQIFDEVYTEEDLDFSEYEDEESDVTIEDDFMSFSPDDDESWMDELGI